MPCACHFYYYLEKQNDLKMAGKKKTLSHLLKNDLLSFTLSDSALDETVNNSDNCTGNPLFREQH